MAKQLHSIEVQQSLFGYVRVQIFWTDGGRLLAESYEAMTVGEARDVIEAVLGHEARRLVPDEDPF